MADVIEDTTLLLELAVVGVIAYFAYKAWSVLSNKGGTNCGPNGGQPCCDPSQVNTNNCVGSDGNPCGTWEFWTATTCYQGTPSVTTQQLQTARQQSSTLGGIGAILNPEPITSTAPASGTLPMQYPLGTAPTPGLPSGYDPATGTIGSGASGLPTAGTPDYLAIPGTGGCVDFLTGLPTC